MKIEKFNMISSTDANYDRSSNPDRLNVFELSPLGISWHYNGQDYKIINERRISAILLKNKIEIALVEAPFDKSYNNKAYIVNACGEIVWNIKESFLAKYRNIYDVNFYYPFYQSTDLYYYVIINNLDFRFFVSTTTREIGELIESR